ncbi:MAG: hypothetical protein PUK48_08345, partial [Spirochaetales bacterium]|nr:hypothetical protein [Spirochaetales bacterium]
MGTDSYKNTTESYMTGDTSFDKLTIYCGSTYFTVDLCGYNLNISTLKLGDFSAGWIKFIDSVGGGSVTIGTIDASTSAGWFGGSKKIYIDYGVTVTLTTNYYKDTGGDITIEGDGTFIISESASNVDEIDEISSSVTVEGDGSNAVFWISKQYTTTYVWGGLTSTDWSVGSNWYYGGYVASNPPGTADAVLIPTLTGTNQPELTQDVSIASLEIRPSMTLSCSSYSLNLSGNLTANGTITSNSTVTIGGNITSCINSLTVGSLSVTGTSSFSNDVTATSGSITLQGDVEFLSSASLSSSSDITISGSFNASDSFTISGNNVVFAGSNSTFSGDVDFSGKNATFLGNTDFSACSSVAFSNSESEIYVFNTETTVHNFTLPSCGISVDKLYIAGNINVNLNGDLSATTGIYVSDPTSGTYYSTSNFTMRFTGSSSVSTSTLDITRCSATNGVIATVEFSCDVDASTEIYGHSGTYIKINSGYTLSSATYIHVAGDTGLLSTLYVAGNLELSGNLNFCSNYESPEIRVTSSGKISCANVLKTSLVAAYHNSSSSYLFINNGEIEVSSSFIFYDDFPYSGSGSIILNGNGAYISNTGSNDVSISEVEIQNTASIGDSSGEGSGAIECETFTATNLGGKTLTLNRDLVVTGTSSSSLVLSGTSESSRLSLVSSSEGNGFIVSTNFSSGNYLLIDKNIVIKDSSGTVTEDVTYTADNSEPSSGTTAADYATVIKHGWIIIKLQSLTYKWTGTESSNWENPKNWDNGLYIPCENASIVIPDNLPSGNYPVLPSSGTFEGGNITIGTSGSGTHDATLTLGNTSLSLSGMADSVAATSIITNYGKIIYTGSGRLTDSSGNFINDTSQGTVEYNSSSGSGNESGTVSDAGGEDYFNLSISGGTWTSSTALAVLGDFIITGNNSSYNNTKETTVTGKMETSGKIKLGGSFTVNGVDGIQHLTNDLTLISDTTLKTTNGGMVFGGDVKGSSFNLILNSASGITCGSRNLSVLVKAIQLTGSFVTTGSHTITFGDESNSCNFFAYPKSNMALGGGTGNIKIYGDFYVLKGASSSLNFSINSPLEAENIGLFDSTISLGTNCNSLSANGDFVLMNGEASLMNDDSESGVSGLYSYNHSGRTVTDTSGQTAAVNMTFPTSLPDGTSIDHSKYTCAFSSGTLNGKTLSAGKNFYANGIDFGDTAAWTLTIPDTGNSTDAFAEMYNCTVDYCSASHDVAASLHSGNRVGSNCTNVYNTQPVFTDVYTVYDNIIHVKVVDGVALAGGTTTQLKIENSNGEITKAISNIYLNDGTVAFDGAY